MTFTLSDHYPTFCILEPVAQPLSPRQEVVHRRIFSKEAYDSFAQKLVDQDWSNLYLSTNADESLAFFEDTVQSHYHSSFQVVSRPKPLTSVKPPIPHSPKLKALRKELHWAGRRYAKHKDNNALKMSYYGLLAHYRSCVRHEHRKYNDEQLRRARESSKGFRRYINQCTGRLRTSAFPSKLNTSCGPGTDPKIVANELASFFSSIGT